MMVEVTVRLRPHRSHDGKDAKMTMGTDRTRGKKMDCRGARPRLWT